MLWALTENYKWKKEFTSLGNFCQLVPSLPLLAILHHHITFKEKIVARLEHDLLRDVNPDLCVFFQPVEFSLTSVYSHTAFWS